MNISDLIYRFMPDYDDIQIPEDDQMEGKLWRSSVFDQNYWETLVKFSFNNEELKSFFDSLTEEDKCTYFGFAVECMMNFVQANFTGPDVPETHSQFFNRPLFEDTNFRKLLSFSNEDINVNTTYPALLCAAKCIFNSCNVQPLLNLWWSLRSVMIHQHILDEFIPELLNQADNLCSKIEMLTGIDNEIKAKFEIEQAQLYNLFRNIPKVRTHITAATNILGFSHELIGKEGKRTKYQSKDIAQLAVKLNLHRHADIDAPSLEKLEVPKNLDLEDDVRLNEIKFKDDIDTHPALTNTEQKLLLAHIQETCISRPRDILNTEEMLSYINVLLRQNNTWPVRASILLIRCRLEKEGSRTIQRCLLQCDEIIESIKRELPHPLNRIGGVYSTNFPPIWKIEAQLAELYFVTDCVKTSLDIYLKLQLWEEVIACYRHLNLRNKAVEIIKQQLEVKASDKLWCLLGDTTDDIACYEKAWELSKQTSSRAQRHWGQFYFSRKQYNECMLHLKLSLNLNPIQPVVWFEYGFAAIQVEDWQAASIAYKYYTSLDPDNFQAWNNLANAYIKLGNKLAAHRALHEAIKCDYNQWRVWDNLMAVSIDLKHFSDVIQAYHQILELKKKHLDVEVLGALVYGVSNNIEDFNGNPAERLMTKTRELFGRISSIYPTNGYVWELYSYIAPDILLKGQRLQRALRGFTEHGWENDPEKCQQALSVCDKLAQVILNDQIQITDSIFNSARLQIASTIATAKKQDFKQIHDLLATVNLCLKQVIDKLTSNVPK